jgi:anti-sigma factor RsiW
MTRPRMTCRQLVDFLMDYLDGGLQPGVRADFEWHLSVCPNCVRYLETYKATVVLERRAFHHGEAEQVPAPVPEELVQAILAARPR